MRLLFSLILSLLLTQVLELAFAFVLRITAPRDLLLLLLVNLLTNPPVVLLATYFPSPIVIVLLELAAVFTEGLIYRRCASSIRRPLLFSLGANTFSYTMGLMLNLLF